LRREKKIVISFTPHLIPVTRGIITTIYAMPRAGVTPQAINEALTAAYGREIFIRLQGEKGTVELKNVVHSNFIDIAWRHDPRTGRVILMSAEDNLTKGRGGPGGAESQCDVRVCGKRSPFKRYERRKRRITAPSGFLAGSIYCGVKEGNQSREDVALIYSETPAVAAGTFTDQSREGGAGAGVHAACEMGGRARDCG